MNPTQSAPASDKRAQVGALLRTADKYIRESKITEAEEELKKVRELEPNNPYAMAFDERISALKKEALKPKEPPAEIKDAPPPAAKAPDVVAEAAKAPDPKATSEKPKIAPPSAPVIRNDIETKLEDDYKQKFAAEIQKAEQRVTDALHQEEEKHAAERAELLEQLQKERSKYKEQMEATFAKKLQDELATAEERFRKEFEEQKQRAEEEIRSRIESEHKLQLKEMEMAVSRERDTLEVKEQQAINLMKQEMETDFASRLVAELDKIKQTSQVKEEKSRLESEKAVRDQLQKEFETRASQERSSIEHRYENLQQQLEESFKAKQQKAIEENQRTIDQKIEEIRKKEEQKFESQKQSYQVTLEKEYEEKIESMRAEERKKQEETSKKMLEAARLEFEKERVRLMDEEQDKLEELRKKLKDNMQEDIRKQLQQATEEITRNYEHKMSLLGIEVPRTKEQKLMIYHNRVREAWSSGPLTMEKAQYLMELQEILQLGFDEHTECEAEVRLQLYAETVQQSILNGKIKPDDPKALEDLKSRFDITSDEAANVEPLILSAFQRIAVKAIILVADDDTALVSIIQERLQELGYSVIGITTLAEAMTTVESSSVDLILSDIQFKGEKGDGFTFFKFVQQKPHLRKIPFILMSSLDEGLFIRTGVQLGVDDYLTKPLDLDLLAAVIEGKLKKYRIMNN